MAKDRITGKRLFLAVTLAFVALGGAWATLIFIATDNAPEPIEVPSSRKANNEDG